MSRTLILVKPDAFERALTGEVIARFERKGLRIAALKTMQADEAIANEHYAEHTEKPFFGELVSFITGGPLVAMVLEGPEAVPAARQLIGATNPVEAAPGSIRGDFALEVTFNMVHGSDSDESAEREIGIWFPELALRRAGSPSHLGSLRPDGQRDPREAGHRASRSWFPGSEESERRAILEVEVRRERSTQGRQPAVEVLENARRRRGGRSATW